jgi:hypothetical protein
MPDIAGRRLCLERQSLLPGSGVPNPHHAPHRGGCEAPPIGTELHMIGLDEAIFSSLSGEHQEGFLLWGARALPGDVRGPLGRWWALGDQSNRPVGLSFDELIYVPKIYVSNFGHGG